MITSTASFLTLPHITFESQEKRTFPQNSVRMRAVHVKTEDSSEVTIERILPRCWQLCYPLHTKASLWLFDKARHLPPLVVKRRFWLKMILPHLRRSVSLRCSLCQTYGSRKTVATTTLFQDGLSQDLTVAQRLCSWHSRPQRHLWSDAAKPLYARGTQARKRQSTMPQETRDSLDRSIARPSNCSPRIA